MNDRALTAPRKTAMSEPRRRSEACALLITLGLLGACAVVERGAPAPATAAGNAQGDEVKGLLAATAKCPLRLTRTPGTPGQVAIDLGAN